jgi:mRNA-degrading endonuclease YafQ of YafQ-DinJ toxin-antitoxin module
MYTLFATRSYINSRDRVVGNDVVLKKRLRFLLEKLMTDPTHPSLKSHKVNTDYGIKWSSWVTGDVRVIWDYDKKQRLVIILVAVGKHSGTHKVYK